MKNLSYIFTLIAYLLFVPVSAQRKTTRSKLKIVDKIICTERIEGRIYSSATVLPLVGMSIKVDGLSAAMSDETGKF